MENAKWVWSHLASGLASQAFDLVFHHFVVAVVAGLALTLLKLIVDNQFFGIDKASDISLDMVLVSVGAIAELYIDSGTRAFDAGVGDAFLAAVLLYIRYLQQGAAPANDLVRWFVGTLQLVLGAASIFWTMYSF